MTALVETRGLTMGYDGAVVVRDLDLRVEAGEVVALLGPNGAGKTTTLLTISGALPVMRGELDVLGSPLGKRSPDTLARQGVAHVPEDRALFASLTVSENLRIRARGARLDADVVPRYFPALAELSDRRAGLLSGGEQQMLAMARALSGRPRLLIVDEMSLGLAPIVVERLLPVLRSVAEDLGCGVLLVEQHVNLALDVADRAYVLNHGDLVLSGSASDLRRDRDLLESSYLGERRLQSTDRPG